MPCNICYILISGWPVYPEFFISDTGIRQDIRLAKRPDIGEIYCFLVNVNANNQLIF